MLFAAKRLGALEDALRTLTERVGALEADRNAHQLELEEMYEKLGRLYGRIRKRQERATQDEELELPFEEPCKDPITAKVQAFREARSHVLAESSR